MIEAVVAVAALVGLLLVWRILRASVRLALYTGVLAALVGCVYWLAGF